MMSSGFVRLRREALIRKVLTMAVEEQRLLLTFDQDFGELARRAGLPASCGVILLRLPMKRSTQIAQAILSRLNERSDWAGHFSVVEPGRIRMRPLG